MANTTDTHTRYTRDTERDPRFVASPDRRSGQAWYYIAAVIVVLALGYWAYSDYSPGTTTTAPVAQTTTDQNNTSNAAPPPADTNSNSTMAPADPNASTTPPAAPAAPAGSGNSTAPAQ